MSKIILNQEKNYDPEGLEYLLKGIEEDANSTQEPKEFEEKQIEEDSSSKGSLQIFLSGIVLFCWSNGEVSGKPFKFKRPEVKHSINEYNNLVEAPYNNFIANFETAYSRKIKKEEVIKKIISFKSLNDKWDGFDAIPLEVDAASNAISFINFLPKKNVECIDEVYPTPNGTTVIFWQNKSGEKVNLEFGSSSFSYYVKYNSQPPSFFNDIKITEKEALKVSKFVDSL